MWRIAAQALDLDLGQRAWDQAGAQLAKHAGAVEHGRAIHLREGVPQRGEGGRAGDLERWRRRQPASVGGPGAGSGRYTSSAPMPREPRSWTANSSSARTTSTSPDPSHAATVSIQLATGGSWCQPTPPSGSPPARRRSTAPPGGAAPPSRPTPRRSRRGLAPSRTGGRRPSTRRSLRPVARPSSRGHRRTVASRRSPRGERPPGDRRAACPRTTQPDRWSAPPAPLSSPRAALDVRSQRSVDLLEHEPADRVARIDGETALLRQLLPQAPQPGGSSAIDRRLPTRSRGSSRARTAPARYGLYEPWQRADALAIPESGHGSTGHDARSGCRGAERQRGPRPASPCGAS